MVLKIPSKVPTTREADGTVESSGAEEVVAATSVKEKPSLWTVVVAVTWTEATFVDEMSVYGWFIAIGSTAELTQATTAKGDEGNAASAR